MVSKLSSLQQRVISAIILAPIVLGVIYLGGRYFTGLVILMAVIMAFEWGSIIHHEKEGEPSLSKCALLFWTILGVFYVGVFAISLVYLRGLDKGLETIMILVLLAWSTDIAAYFTGKFIGGPKICSSISPNKTWAGLSGGMLAAAIVSVILSQFTSYSFMQAAIFGGLFAIIAQIGDFFESYVKRKFGVKDSSNIIPGHGGVMDRMDGFVTTTPFFVYIAIVNGGIFVI